MSKTQEYRDFSLKAFEFIAGLTDDHPELKETEFSLKRFIDARSRVVELREMRDFHAVVNSRFTKNQYIEFFCNLQAFERRNLLAKLPDTIIALPSDCKNFKIDRPKAIALRSGNFSGKTVEFKVYAIADFLKLVKQNKELVCG